MVGDDVLRSKEALRVLRAVTRLTVYRPLEILVGKVKIAQKLNKDFEKLDFFYLNLIIAVNLR